MPTLRFVLEYDGTDFAGWQAQAPGARTVQGVLESALRHVTGVSTRVVGAGRTDAGVHAEGQVASCRIETRLGAATLARALNAVLPADLAVRSLEEAPFGFDARRAARRKLYRYRVWNGAVRSPLRERTHAFVRAPLDLAAMRRAAAILEGRHDFASFETRGREADRRRSEPRTEHPEIQRSDTSDGAGVAATARAVAPRSTVRTLFRVAVAGERGGDVAFELEGDGFLRYMVRTVAGTLLEVGRGVRPESDIARILAARDRREAGPTAPAHGLVLVRVEAPGAAPSAG